jgi:predicted alpha/beta superfamily hydrolase
MKPFVIGLCGSLLAVAASAQDTARSITIGERLSMHSAVLGEERPYWVHVPASYLETKYAPRQYPVLYLLDGDANFYGATGAIHFMSSGTSGNIQIPELIVVAVLNTDRTRDLTPTHTIRRPEGDDPSLKASGGGDAFLKFLNDELIPHIDRTYRTKPYRIIVGHSFGGLLALHAFRSAPDIFQAYVAIDPSLFWDNQAVVRRFTEGVRKENARKRAVYISLSSSYSEGYRGEAVTTFAKRLEASAGVRSTLQYFAAENHQSVPFIALYHGLLFVFEGYQLAPGEIFEQSSTLATHFEMISKQIGVDLLPPERFIDQVAQAFLDAKRIDKAIDLFKFNASSNPTSFNAYSDLAQAYAANGDLQLAIQNYEASLRLNPDNQIAKERLRALTGRQPQR